MSPQREQQGDRREPSQLPVTAASGARTGTSRFSSVMTTQGSGPRADGRREGCQGVGHRQTSMHFNARHVFRRSPDISYGLAKLQRPHNKETEILFPLHSVLCVSHKALHPHCWNLFLYFFPITLIYLLTSYTIFSFVRFLIWLSPALPRI